MITEEVFVYERKVHYYETDKMGISHHSNYIRWMEEARMCFLEQCGADYCGLEKLGIESPVVAVECHYRSPSTYADVLYITVDIDYFNGVRLRFRYHVYGKCNKLVADGITEHCFINSDGKVLNMKKAYPEFWMTLQKFMI